MNARVEDLVEEGRTIYFSPSTHPDNYFDAGVFPVQNTPSSYAFLEEWFSRARKAEECTDSDNGVLHYVLAARLPEYDHFCDHYATVPNVHLKPCLKRCLGRPDVDFGEILITPRLAIAAGEESTVEYTNAALKEEGAL